MCTQNGAGCILPQQNRCGMLHSIYTVFLSEMASSSSEINRPSDPIVIIPLNMNLKLVDNKYQAGIASNA